MAGQTAESAARQPEDAAMARRKAPHLVKARCALKEGCAGRRAVPLAFMRGKKREYGVPRAAKNRGDDACQKFGVMPAKAGIQ